MRDKYFDPDGWKKCTLRNNIELGQDLWLLCGTCQKSRYYDTASWAAENGVDLDTPMKMVGKAIRCQRCGTMNVSVYAKPYDNLPPETNRYRYDDDAICPRCGGDDVRRRRLLTTDFPSRIKRTFLVGSVIAICGCEACDNWWAQANGDKLPRDDGSGG